MPGSSRGGIVSLIQCAAVFMAAAAVTPPTADSMPGSSGMSYEGALMVDLSNVTLPEHQARLELLVSDSFLNVPVTTVFQLLVNDRALQELSKVGLDLTPTPEEVLPETEAVATSSMTPDETSSSPQAASPSSDVTGIPSPEASASPLDPETRKKLPDVGKYQEQLEFLISGRFGSDPILIKPTDDDFEDAFRFLNALQSHWDQVPDLEIPEIKHLWTMMANRTDLTERLQELTATEKEYGVPMGSTAAAPPSQLLQVDENRLRAALGTVLSVSRHHGKKAMRDLETAALHVSSQFDSFGLLVFNHVFSALEYPVWYKANLTGTNVIGVLPGKRWGHPEDAPVVIGAHLDTVKSTPGVDDNGSGVAGLLEAARVLSTSNCHFENSIIFVAFDLEEIGAQGSAFFVKDFLGVLLRNTLGLRRFTGAIVLDCIAIWDPTPNSQDIPDQWHTFLPRFTLRVQARESRGDFAALIYRTNVDGGVAHTFSKYYSHLGEDQYRLEPMAVSGLGVERPDASVLLRHYDMLRSDHIRFWYPVSRDHLEDLQTIPAILISDLGPFRGSMRKCYHRPCDGPVEDISDLGMATKVTQASVWALAELAEGQCRHPKNMPTKHLFEVMKTLKKKGQKPTTPLHQDSLDLLHSLGPIPNALGPK